MHLRGDASPQLGDVAHEADDAPALAQAVEDVHHLVEGVLVERAEALVDEQRLDARAARLGLHDVGQSQGERERGEERLAAGERARVPLGLDAVVEDLHRQSPLAREDVLALLAADELERARRCAASLEGLAGDVTAAEVELADLRAWADQVTALADLATGRGSNALRMRLQSFVLAARLEQVADVASRRLQDMSGGRYTFLHSDAQGRHGARGGLGLDVFDEYTGVRRPTKTLSGGESFMASLALALGLADVVTAETGGVQIDTLFVDEGFGTLDPETLEAVLVELGKLRAGGRVVGVVSHVEALKQSIAERIEVRRLPDGSSTLAVRAG